MFLFSKMDFVDVFIGLDVYDCIALVATDSAIWWISNRNHDWRLLLDIARFIALAAEPLD